jgi:histidine triad (HIT) family protein
MKDCIFCQIVTGKSPCYKIYEDENFFGFLDIFPRVKGHTVLVPKVHYRWVYDVPDFSAYWQAALKITKAMQSSLNSNFVTYVTHGLEVPHAHIHIMPRGSGETGYIPEIKKFSPEEFTAVAQKISSAM